MNPNSGPGSTQYPDTVFTALIGNLTAYSNVRTVGYVPTAYGTRNITAVLSDIATYSGWASATTANKKASLAVDGIFFDEVVSEYSTSAAQYLQTINQAAKSATGLLSDKLVRINKFRIVFAFTRVFHSFTEGVGALSFVPDQLILRVLTPDLGYP